MLVLFAMLLILCFAGCKLAPRGEKFVPDYMSVEKTMSIKGIFIILVFFLHFNSYVFYTMPLDKIYLSGIKEIGQCVVTLFMLYSGYGVMESVKKKGLSYVHRIPLQRILGTYFRFDIAIIIFALVQLLIGKIYPIKQYFLSLTAWDAIGNSNWYIFAVAFLYLLTFIVFEIAGRRGNYYIPTAIFTAVLIAVVIVCDKTNIRHEYWYDTLICYALGMWYSLLRDKIERLFSKSLAIYHVVLAVFMVASWLCMEYRNRSLAMLLLCMSLFAMTVVLVTMRISFHNKALMWCGKNLFGLYILQRIPMLLLKHWGLTQAGKVVDLGTEYFDFNIILCFVISAVVTVLLALVFEKITGRLWEIITSAGKKNT